MELNYSSDYVYHMVLPQRTINLIQKKKKKKKKMVDSSTKLEMSVSTTSTLESREARPCNGGKTCWTV